MEFNFFPEVVDGRALYVALKIKSPTFQRKYRISPWVRGISTLVLPLIVLAAIFSGGLTPFLTALVLDALPGLSAAYALAVGATMVAAASMFLGYRIGQTAVSWWAYMYKAWLAVGISLSLLVGGMLLATNLLPALTMVMMVTTGVSMKAAMAYTITAILSASIYVGYEAASIARIVYQSINDIRHNKKMTPLERLYTAFLYLTPLAALSLVVGVEFTAPLTNLVLDATSIIGFSGLSSTAALTIGLIGVGAAGMLVGKYLNEILFQASWTYSGIKHQAVRQKFELLEQSLSDSTIRHSTSTINASIGDDDEEVDDEEYDEGNDSDPESEQLLPNADVGQPTQSLFKSMSSGLIQVVGYFGDWRQPSRGNSSRLLGDSSSSSPSPSSSPASISPTRSPYQ